jgi:hypothetical protein
MGLTRYPPGFRPSIISSRPFRVFLTIKIGDALGAKMDDAGKMQGDVFLAMDFPLTGHLSGGILLPSSREGNK